MAPRKSPPVQVEIEKIEEEKEAQSRTPGGYIITFKSEDIVEVYNSRYEHSISGHLEREGEIINSEDWGDLLVVIFNRHSVTTEYYEIFQVVKSKGDTSFYANRLIYFYGNKDQQYKERKEWQKRLGDAEQARKWCERLHTFLESKEGE